MGIPQNEIARTGDFAGRTFRRGIPRYNSRAAIQEQA